jgi:hypothetical protein
MKTLRSRHAALVLVLGAVLVAGTARVLRAASAATVEAEMAPAAGAAAANAPATDPEIKGFRAFCDIWMQKLRDRETYNTSHIIWDRRDGQVTGEHVGYGSESRCEAHQESGKDPIGTITYREMRYRRQGATPAEALAAPGTIVEQSDVTEIFRYAKGAWQY